MNKELTREMIKYLNGDVKRINHMLKVRAFSELIADGEKTDGKIKDIPNGQGIPIWNGMSVRFELGEEWNLRLMQQVEERMEDEDEQTV